MPSAGVRGVAKSLPTVKNFIVHGTTSKAFAVWDTAEAADTIASTATVRVTGSLSQTEAADTVGSAGTVRVTGSLSKTEAADTVGSTGTVRVTASCSATDVDLLSSAATLTIHGAASVTDSDIMVAAGTVVTPPPPVRPQYQGLATDFNLNSSDPFSVGRNKQFLVDLETRVD